MSKSHRPPEEDKPARRSWRGGGGGAGGGSNGASRGQVASFGWRQGRAPTNYAARKWLIGVPMILGVLGLFVLAYYVINRLPTPTPLVCVRISDYESPLAPQAFAQEDVELLQRLFTPQFAADSVAVPDAESVVASIASDKTVFLAELKEALDRQQPGPGKPLLIYLSAQGLVNDAGQACLVMAADRRQPLAGVATPSQLLPPSRLLAVEELIDGLAEHSSPEHPVVLLLDAVRWDRNWRLGIAANDFVARLGDIDFRQAGREHIVIVNSTASDDTSSGEIGLVDLRRGLTLFGQYVARGLAGEADTDDDDAIGLAEFRAYLTDKLTSAAARRGRIQRPSLFAHPALPDLRLASASSERGQQAAAQIIDQRFSVDQGWLSDIHAGFRTLAQWQERRRQGEFAPAATLLLEEAQRQHWQHELGKCLAGKAYVKENGTFSLSAPAAIAPPVADDDDVWQAATLLVPPAAADKPQPPSFSLPLALGSATPSEEQQQRGRAALNAPPAPPAGTPPAEGAPAVKPPAASPAEVAWAAWDHALGAGGLSAEQQANLDKHLAEAGFLVPVELRTLERFSPRNTFLPTTIKEAGRDLMRLWNVRQQAEWAAFLAGEPRTLPLVAARLDQFDNQRRRVEDRLFLASTTVESDALVELAGSFTSLEAEAQAAAAAVAARDEALADMPYLLEWAAVGGEARAQQASQLVAALARLQQSLDAPPSPDAVQPTDWAALGQAVKGSHDALLAVYRDQWKANVDEAPETGYLGQYPALERLLATPLLNLAERQNLWNVYRQVLESGELEPAAEGSASFDPKAAAEARKSERTTAQRLLTEWLATQKRGGEAAPTFSAWADRGVSELAPFSSDALPADLAQQLARREPGCRAVACWITLRPGAALLSANSVQQHAEHAAYQYFAWQAQRALDDFHGSGDQRIAADHPPFALAAAALLTFAERAYFPHIPAAAQRDLLAARRADARRLGEVTLHWPARPLATGQTSLVVERWPTAVDVQALPAGEAAFRVAGDFQEVQIEGSGPRLPSPAQEKREVQPHDASWPASLKFTLTAEQPTVTPEVTYYYRGHAARLDKLIPRLAPLYVVDSASPGPTGKLTVHPSLSKAHVVIVLDCSASMAAWMGDANQAVRTVIDRLLLKADDVQVSLVLFAHRRSKDVELSGTVVKWKWNSAFGPDDPSRTLFNDVAVVWRNADGEPALDEIIGRADGINPRDPKVKATGLTPLFRSLSFALTEGFTDRDAGSRHLVIISDGDDYVQTRRDWELNFREKNKAAGRLDAALALLPRLEYQPAWPAEEAEYNSDQHREERADLVKKGIAARKPSVYLFDLSKANELAEVADLAGLGKPIAVKSPTELANAVLKQMGVLDYTLDDQDEGTDRSGRTTQTATFADLPVGAYTLRLAGQADSAAPLRIGGGEGLEVDVAYADGRPRFAFRPHEPPVFDAQARGRIALGDAAIDPALAARLKSYDVQCRAERAPRGERDASRCTFELVFQNSAGKDFTPRPVELWVEIAPVGGSVPGGSYVYCNPFCRAQTRVPVYELVAPQWPDAADRAQVSVWVRMQPTQSKDAVVDASFASPKPLPDPLAEPGVLFQFEAQASQQGPLVKVTELFGQGAKPRAWHFVTPTPNLGTSRVTRTYYDGQVEHQFVFGTGNVEDAEQRRFIALPIDNWKKLAVGLAGDQPLVVRVPE
jgi:hypothetical protein